MKKNAIILFIIFTFTLSIGATEQQASIVKNMDIYNAVWRELSINYVDTINYDQLNKIAIDRMLQKLDPYTVYIPESEEDDLKMMTTGAYGGIGAIITQKGDYVCISEPYEGMPAQKNDVRAGDLILELNGKSMKGKKTSEVSQLLRGLQGTEIELLLQRPGEKRSIKKHFLREVIQIDPVEYYGMVGDSTAYISLRDFTDKTTVGFRNAMADLTQNRGVKNLVIDLRNNGGGLVTEAINIAGLFLPKHTLVVTMKGLQPQNNKSYKTTSEPLYPNMPVVVLVNTNSASASEILAGVFQDMDRAVVLGERTYGKGLVQTVRRLPHNTYLKVTTSKYYIPSGRCVQAIDYAHRNEDGSIGRIPDSLTTEFTTRNGRKVRDGGGILPDTLLKRRDQVNISYYLFVKNIFFDYATEFAQKHKTIATPDSFVISDAIYDDFVKYVLDRKFTYKLESEGMIRELKKMAKLEGYEQESLAAFETLEEVLRPNVERDLQLFRKDVESLLGSEIVRRYYFQKGVVEYELRFDEWLHDALKVVNDEYLCRQILHVK
ncbi:MAG TPA: S41 family peptidase [Paludibacteraceae bacterium]|nr:S41 family peptidase [Paludibacteraceae bacterium]HQB68864.1 S41 family peptidase [Paludibacteraceae bacterium]